MVRSKTTDSHLSAQRSQSRSPGGQRFKGSGSSIGIARSRTQEDVRKLEETQEDDFLAEELDLGTILAGGLQRQKDSAKTDAKDTETEDKIDSEQIGSKADETVDCRKEEKVVHSDSSSYDSDSSDGEVDPKTLYSIECPSYDDFLKTKASANVEVKVEITCADEVSEELQNPVT